MMIQVTGSILSCCLIGAVHAAQYVPDARPPSGLRKLEVEAVEERMKVVGSVITDENLRQMWQNTYPSTLDTTLQWHNFDNQTCHVTQGGAPCPLAYLTSGDIPAMWIRDSANQILHYADLIETDRTIEDLFLGTINMQSYYIREYEWANAFKAPEWTGHVSGENPWATDDDVFPEYDSKVVWEAKYELDTWGAFFRLVTTFWDNSRDDAQRERLFEGYFTDAFLIILGRLEQLQLGTKDIGWDTFYSFSRPDRRPTETQHVLGNGNPGRRTGLVRSLFRPSDDATVFPYLIPSNMMLTVGLRGMLRVIEKQDIGEYISVWVEHLVDEIETSIAAHGTVQDADCVERVATNSDAEGSVGAAKSDAEGSCRHYVYEVDGFGGINDMDDPTIPNLLTAPLYGFTTIDDPIYQRTRARSLDVDTNPWYFRNTTTGIEGLGSPHTGLHRVWPMAVASQAMTTRDRVEILRCLRSLLDMQAGTGLMHEGVNTANPRDYTRQWFGWANSVFAQLILHLYNDAELRSVLEEFVYVPTMAN